MNNIIFQNQIWNDYPQKGQMAFQDPATDWQYAIIDLHDRIQFYLIIIQAVVVWFQVSGFQNKNHLPYLHHGNQIEQIWTQTPAGILWAIGLPSQRQLYLIDEVQDAEITIKAIGNQWYWSYEYSDYIDNGINVAYDSFMVDEASQNPGELRNQTVDNKQVVPVNTSIRLIITSNDVIHSFAIPSQAQKTDAIPGRLNSTGFIVNRTSTYYGQCSEQCGVQHGFMPIELEVVELPKYLSFLESYNE